MKYDFLKDEVLKNKLVSKIQRDKDDKLLSFNILSEEQINSLFLNEIRKEKLLKINLLCSEKEKSKRLVSRKK